MVSIKRIALDEGKRFLRIPLEKKDENVRRGKEIREREKRRREFMFRTHGNLWAANWRGVRSALR